MRQVLARVDEASANIERGVVLVLLSLMAGVVFFDVLHRVASSPEGLMLRLLTLFAGNPAPDTLARLRSVGVPVTATVLAYAFFYGAVRTRAAEATPRRRSALVALGFTAAAIALLFLVLNVFPNGLVWSQPLALALLLWVALFGATLATRARGHIAFEVADRIWPAAFLPWARLVSGLIAGAFCFAIVVLSIHYVSDFFAQWREDGVGFISGVPLPKWVAYLAIPVSFVIMGLRFTGYALGDFLARGERTGEVKP